jgi:hypothetical protein
MSVNVQVGSIVYGRSGKPLSVVAVYGDVLLISAESGYRKVHKSAILKVEPPKPDRIKIGDRVCRNSRPSPKYPKKWFVNGVDKRPSMIAPIESAIVLRFSSSGAWVETDAGDCYHVSDTAFELGDWERGQT